MKIWTIKEIVSSVEVSRFPVNIYPVKFDEKCIPEFCFLKLWYQGVFVAIAKVNEYEDKDKYSNDDFVYNKNYYETVSYKKVYDLIDNWDDFPIKIIKQKDLEDERTAKLTLNTFFEDCDIERTFQDWKDQ